MCAVRTAEHVAKYCAAVPDCLVHLYWPKREHYFQENIVRLCDEGSWLLVATPGHGLRRCERPTINFLLADCRFAAGYPEAARARRLRHGVLIRRSTFSLLADSPGYELAEIGVVRHPNALRAHTVDQDWKYDIGKYRYGAIHGLSHAGFVRLATPGQLQARCILVPREAIVLVW